MSFPAAYTIAAPDSAAYQKLEQAFQEDLQSVNMGSTSLPVRITFHPETRTISIGYALDIMQTILPLDSKVMDLLPIRKTLYELFKEVDGNTFQAGDYHITRKDGNPFTEKEREILRAEELAAVLPPKTAVKCAPNTPPHQLVTSLLDKHQGVCIGESHIETVARMLIAGQMREWRNKGVKKIFIETLRREFNPMLQHYYSTPDATLPPVIEKWLDQADDNIKKMTDSSYQPNRIMQTLLRSAKDEGIEIYGLSSAIAFVPGLRSQDASIRRRAFYERGILWNAVAAETIQSLIAPNEKFVALCGNGHLGEVRIPEQEKPVIGLDRFLNAPAVFIETCKQGEAPRIGYAPSSRQIEHICWLDPVVLGALKGKDGTIRNAGSPPL